MILAALRDPALSVRVAAVEQLEAMPLREQALASGESLVREVGQLASQLCAESAELRGRPFRIFQLPATTPLGGHEFERGLLTASDVAVRSAALSAIRSAGPVAVALMPTLRALALSDSETEIRRSAMSVVLGAEKTHNCWSLAMVLLALRDRDPEIVGAALRVVSSEVMPPDLSPLLCDALVGVIRHSELPADLQSAVWNLVAARDDRGTVLLPAVQESLVHPSARTVRLLGAMERWIEYQPLALPPAKARDLLTRVCSAVFRGELVLRAADDPVGLVVAGLAGRLQHLGAYQATVLGALAHRFGGDAPALTGGQRTVYQILTRQFLGGGESREGRAELSYRVLQRLVEVPDTEFRSYLARAFFRADPVGFVLPPLLLDYATKRRVRHNLVRGALEVLAAYAPPDYSSAYLDVISSGLRRELPELRRRTSKESPERGLVDLLLSRFPSSRPSHRRGRDAGKTGS